MPTWGWVVVVILVITAADRLLLAAEARRWVNYRKTPARKGTAAEALLSLHHIFEPDKKHVLEEQAREEDKIEREASGDPPDGRAGPMSTIRAATRDDLAAVVDVMNAYDVSTLGQPDSSEEDVLANWADSTFDLGRDAYVAEDDGLLVGYTEVYDRGEAGQLDIDLFCRPEAVPDAGPLLLAKAMSRAYERGGTEVVLASWVPEETTTADVFAGAGFAPVRAFHRMRATLDGPVTPPTPPDGVTLRPVRRGEDERTVHEVLADAFANHVRPLTKSYEKFVEQHVDHPEYDPSLWALAEAGDRVIGAITVFNHDDVGFIRHVGVRADARGRGIASALILRALALLEERGQHQVDLGVDVEDEVGAARLYEALGFATVQRLQLVERRPAQEGAQ